MKTFSRIAIAALALVTSTSTLHAQVDYNRQATKISIQPNKDGSHRITGFWQAQFDTDLAVDLSTHVVLAVNGAMMWDGHVTVLKAADTGGGPCPTNICPGNPSCGSTCWPNMAAVPLSPTCWKTPAPPIPTGSCGIWHGTCPTMSSTTRCHRCRFTGCPPCTTICADATR